MAALPKWSPVWMYNADMVAEWLRAITIVCDATTEDMQHFRAFRASHITNDTMRDVVFDIGCDLGNLVTWCERGLHALRDDGVACKACTFPVFTPTQSDFAAWTEWVVNGQSSDALQSLRSVVIEKSGTMDETLDDFRAESAGSYSSYSDYSDQTSSSSEDEYVAPTPRRKR